jgi:hypothetical protein
MDDLTPFITDPMHRAVMDAMQAIVDATPDEGEGSRFHIRSDIAWWIIENYRLTLTEDGRERMGMEIYWENSSQTDALPMRADHMRLALVAEAAKAMQNWLEYDLNTHKPEALR